LCVCVCVSQSVSRSASHSVHHPVTRHDNCVSYVLCAVRSLFAAVDGMQSEQMLGATWPSASPDNCSPLRFCAPLSPHVHLRWINNCFRKQNWQCTQPTYSLVCWYSLVTPKVSYINVLRLNTYSLLRTGSWFRPTLTRRPTA
jgi:hypothetical protein